MFAYKHLVGYLHRYTLIHFKRVHCRIHHIKRTDFTPFLHTHPFSYISIILWGGYTEEVEDRVVMNRLFSVICRKATTAHRIVAVKPGTITLFLTWKTDDQKWQFKRLSKSTSVDWITYPKGLYVRRLYDKIVFSKFDQYWHKAALDLKEAREQTSPSIDQSTKPLYPVEFLKHK